MRVTGSIVLLGMVAACAAPPVAKPVAPPEVRFARVGTTSAANLIKAVGTVGLRRETSLGFTSPGRIARLTVEDGDAVRRGQMLAALDMTTVGADLSAARAERERAAAEYARSTKLFEQGWITRPRLDGAKATLASADARVRASGFQSNNAVIVAPGPGRILARLAEPGQVVAAGTPVLVLGEESGGYVLRVPLTDRDLAAVRSGAPATVRIAALGGAALAGQIVELGGRAERTTGTFAAEVALPADVRLRAGQIGNVSIVANGTGTRIEVPPAAIFAPRAGEAFVYVFDREAKRVRLRKVAIAEASDGATRVTGGLQPGEFVATSRIDRLTDKMAVRPIAPPPIAPSR